MQNRKRNLSPIIKVVSAGCNLRCGYCFFFGHQNKIELMDTETLELVIVQSIQASPRRVRFQWHGGEPFLAGLEFYREAVALQEKHRLRNQKVLNSIQTNGTLINEEWVSFLQEACFGVGVSLDGPEEMHDLGRYDAGSQGTFGRVMRGVELLRQGGVKFGVIAVINDHNVRYPREMYEFFSSQRLSFSPNACVMRDPETGLPTGFSVNPMDYAQFMIEICDLWLAEDNPSLRIRPLVNIIQGLIGVPQGLCEFRGTCEQFLTIDSNGDIYPCDRFLETEFCLGNVNEVALTAVPEAPAYRAYYARRSEVAQRCEGCEWLPVCAGGCLRHWEGLTEEGGRAWNRFCGARKLLFQHVKKRLEEIGEL